MSNSVSIIPESGAARPARQCVNSGLCSGGLLALDAEHLGLGEDACGCRGRGRARGPQRGLVVVIRDADRPFQARRRRRRRKNRIVEIVIQPSAPFELSILKTLPGWRLNGKFARYVRLCQNRPWGGAGKQMTTQAKYDAVKELYKEEHDRRTRLGDNANRFLALISAYSAFTLFVIEKRPPHSLPSVALFFITTAAFMFGLVASVMVLTVATYERPFDPEKFAKSADMMSADDSGFFTARIIDFAFAYKVNMRVNAVKARWLKLAAYALILGIAAEAAYLTSSLV